MQKTLARFPPTTNRSALWRLTPIKLSVKFLFEQKHTFEVPKYQRGFAWDDDAIDDFVEDIARCLKARESENSRNHFFGGVVTANKNVSNSSRSNFEVIDGQQRIASFVMLAAAIRQSMLDIVGALEKQHTLEANEKKSKSFLDETIKVLHNTYLVYRDESELEYIEVPKLTLSKADDEFFQSVVRGQAADPERASHKLIQKAWDRLVDFVEKEVLKGATPSEKAKQIQCLVNSVLALDCSVIFMRAGSRSEAYQIFQVLNDRGVHLTDGDLLRASTMEHLDQQSFAEIQNKVADAWDRVLAYPPVDIDSYLRWYFSSWEGKRPKPPNLADQFLEYRFKCKNAETVGSDGAAEILKEVRRLEQDFSTLRTLGDGDWPYENQSQVSGWDRERLRMLVTHLKHTNAMPLLLSLQLLEEKKFSDAVASIERFVFRYKTIGNAHTSPMTELYHRHAKKIRDVKNYSIRALKKDLAALVGRVVPDGVFEANLHELKYSPRGSNRHINYLLITLEDYWRWHMEGANGVPKCKDKKRVFDVPSTTIDHVYPQSAETKDKKAELEAIKHSLGNLTILGPEDNNTSANKAFADKKPVLARSGLNLNHPIAENDDWTVHTVNQRTKDLIAMALKVFIP